MSKCKCAVGKWRYDTELVPSVCETLLICYRVVHEDHIPTYHLMLGNIDPADGEVYDDNGDAVDVNVYSWAHINHYGPGDD